MFRAKRWSTNDGVGVIGQLPSVCRGDALALHCVSPRALDVFLHFAFLTFACLPLFVQRVGGEAASQGRSRLVRGC